MRVTIVSETYFPQVNGVSRTLGQLVGFLTRSGDTVQLIHPDYGIPAPGEQHYRVRSIRAPFYPDLHLPLPPFGGVRRAIDAFQPDLVHIATEAALGLGVLRHALRSKVPTVSSFHTNFHHYSHHYGVGWARNLVWRYLRWFHNRTLETYVPSQTTIAELEGRGFERLVLWPRGVDGTVFRPDRPGRQRVRESLSVGPDDLVIGHVSRIAAEKNVAYLGEALATVARERPRVRLLIVGDGPARPELAARLGPAAIFVGFLSGDELLDHFAACDLFAFASRTETFGNVILEAMASGLPVVAIRAGGPGDIVRPEETGLLLEPEDPPERFAAALIRLIDDPELRGRMAAAARVYAESQTWDAIMAALRDRYANLIGSSATVMG